jgi:hypothetical protein
VLPSPRLCIADLQINVNARIHVSMTIEDVKDMLREACLKAGSQAIWAQQHGVSASYVSDVIQGRREPGDKVLKALGLDRIIIYKRVR